MQEPTRDADDLYIEAGESTGTASHFSVAQIAAAFEVAPERIARAMHGEFGLGADGLADSRMAQHLAEVLLGDQPLDQREAALMQLGAYTPRSDAVWGAGSGPPDEESDRQRARAGVNDERLASERSSHDPATQPAADG